MCVCVCSQTPLTQVLCPAPTPHLGTFQGEALWSDGLVGGLICCPGSLLQREVVVGGGGGGGTLTTSI